MRERRDRHLAAADYLERTFADDDEMVEVLASHYLDAYTAGPDVDGADAVRRRAQRAAGAGRRACQVAGRARPRRSATTPARPS